MVERTVTITNIKGLHLQAAKKIAETASAFESEVHIRKDDVEVDAKSLMGLLVLVASLGSDIVVTADGSDENDALGAIVGLVEAKFHEEA
jgi:phosphocarrier protein